MTFLAHDLNLAFMTFHHHEVYQPAKFQKGTLPDEKGHCAISHTVLVSHPPFWPFLQNDGSFRKQLNLIAMPDESCKVTNACRFSVQTFKSTA